MKREVHRPYADGDAPALPDNGHRSCLGLLTQHNACEYFTLEMGIVPQLPNQDPVVLTRFGGG